MIVLCFKVRCQPGTGDQVVSALQDVVSPSRAMPGVISFDIGRDVSDPDAFFAMEVFKDQAALDHQNALPEVRRVLDMLERVQTDAPDVAVYSVSTPEPLGS
jgi:quinol monooxygenase YgiN